MASKISSDISTNIDITCRKGDTFFLIATLKNSDDSNFNLNNFNFSEFVVTNSNDNTVRKFYLGSGTTTTIDIYNVITKDVGSATLTINVPGGKMNIPAGNYKYIHKIINANTNGGIHTILHGKFKIID